MRAQEGGRGGSGGGVCAGGCRFSPYSAMFFYMYDYMAGLVFAQVYAEDAADGHDAIEEGAVVGCGGGDGDAASLFRGS